jgi:cytochrome c biogenesis protein CcdA
VFVGAVVAALVAGPDGGGLALLGDAISGRAGEWALGLATAMPMGLAFAAGVVAAANPCGFVLLPGIVGMLLDRDGRTGVAARVLRALLVSLVVTLAFVAMFGTAGLLLGTVSAALAGSFAWLGLGAGVILLATAGWTLAGRSLPSGLGGRLASGLEAPSRRPGVLGCAAYGVAYGLASLGCALPPFLAVVGTALSPGGIRTAVIQLVLYALGLASVLSAATIATALLQLGPLARLRWAMRSMPALGSGLLLAAGAYVSYYWLTVGGAITQLLGPIRIG